MVSDQEMELILKNQQIMASAIQRLEEKINRVESFERAEVLVRVRDANSFAGRDSGLVCIDGFGGVK